VERRLGARALAAYASLALAPCALRLAALVDAERAVSFADLRGLWADLGVSALVLAALAALGSRARWPAAVVAGLLAVGYYANFETILALGSMASALDLEFLGDKTFVWGSAAALSRPLLAAALVAGSCGLAWWGLGRPVPRLPLVALAAGGGALATLLAWPVDAHVETWRQANTLERNLQWAATNGLRPGASGGEPPAAMVERLPELRADLSGEPRFRLDRRGDNVLLVILEGVSGAYLDTAARVHGRRADTGMPNIDRAFRENVGYATFISHNRRTNHGLYTLLCGELPGLVRGTPKMTVAASAPWQKCLPEALGEVGYRTVFLQAAPLAFMLKDRFMPRAGFQQVLGNEWFHEYYVRNDWGVDDRAFLEQAVGMVESLAAARQPWFLTLLSVGTHHPFILPPDAGGRADGNDPRAAFHYLDGAIGAFLERIESLGIRDDTLILLTSDESAGVWDETADARAARLTQNWGYLVAMLPGRERALVTEPFAQSDLALSVLDYLGLGERGGQFLGRSVFRTYPAGRHLFFANLNFGTIGGLAPDGRLLHCESEGRECSAFQPEAGRVFAEELAAADVPPELRELVVDIAHRSLPPAPEGDLEIALAGQDPVFTVDRRKWQVVHGLPEITVQPSDWLEVDFSIEARGTGRVEIQHALRFKRERRRIVVSNAILEGGSTFHGRYTLAADEPISEITLHNRARLRQGWKMDLVSESARVVVHRGGTRPPRGVRVARFEVEAPSAIEPQRVKVHVMKPGEIEKLARTKILSPSAPEDPEG
jgi:hypothetical protein